MSRTLFNIYIANLEEEENRKRKDVDDNIYRWC